MQRDKIYLPHIKLLCRSPVHALCQSVFLSEEFPKSGPRLLPVEGLLNLFASHHNEKESPFAFPSNSFYFHFHYGLIFPLEGQARRKARQAAPLCV